MLFVFRVCFVLKASFSHAFLHIIESIIFTRGVFTHYFKGRSIQVEQRFRCHVEPGFRRINETGNLDQDGLEVGSPSPLPPPLRLQELRFP